MAAKALSLNGTFETCQGGLMMSVVRGRREVTGTQPTDAIAPKRKSGSPSLTKGRYLSPDEGDIPTYSLMPLNQLCRSRSATEASPALADNRSMSERAAICRLDIQTS
jgi:hypothetical protein